MEWSPSDKSGNPPVGVCVSQYLAFSCEEQKKSEISPRQGTTLLVRPDLYTLLISMRARMACKSLACRIALFLVRDVALFAGAFHAGRRGIGRHHTLGSGVMKLPEHECFILNFHFAKTVREGGAQVASISADTSLPASFPVGALSSYSDAEKSCLWNLGRAYLFPQFDSTQPVTAARLDKAMAPRLMTKRLRHHMEAAGLTTKKYTMRSFRVGAAVSQA